MLDKEQIKKNFSKSAEGYEDHAGLQKEIAEALFQSVVRCNPESVLDIGCGTGYLANRMAQHFPLSQVTGIDIAPEMVRVAQERHSRDNLRFLEGNGEKLSFPEQTFDAVVSNAAFQWMDFSAAAGEVRRVLKPGGHFIFTTFGPGTLQELRKLGLRTNRMLSIDEIKTILNGMFIDKEFAGKQCVQKFDSLRSLRQHLKNIGAQTVDSGVQREARVSALKQMRGEVSVTFEVIFGFSRRS
jgi:malonyl-CoA O-methyltransferase